MILNPIANHEPTTGWQKHWAGLSLLGLTIVAAGIRFLRLSVPCLWYDESRVYYRVCGTYSQLLDCLRSDGFGPLHYQLYWVIVHSVALPTPEVMRLIPAFCGTLMVPAIYFLARQLLPKRTSLLAAAFTVCSAFMIFYSRDAKMYMETWLLVTLGMASLIWWFRTDRSTAWLCWIAASAAAGGIHATSLITLPISLLFLLSQKTMRWQKSLLWLLGVIIITAGPVGYYEAFNTWTGRVAEDWHNSELEWIGIYNHGRSGPELSRYLGSCMLMGWEWPRDNVVPPIGSVRVNVPIVLFTTLIVIFIAGMFPWPQRWRGNRGVAPLPQPRWRTLLWLSLWIMLPAYAFYCRSIANFSSPMDWFQSLVDLVPAGLRQLLCDHAWPWMLIGLAIGAGMTAAYVRTGSRSLAMRGLELIAVILAVMGLCWGIYAACAPAAKAAAEAGKPWVSIWVPRYIGVIWPAVALVAAALVMRLPTLPVRIIAMVVLLGVNLFYGGARIFTQTEPPVDLMTTDALAAKNSANHTLIWLNLRPGQQAPGGGNVLGECGVYYAQSISPKPMSPAKFKAESGQLKWQSVWAPQPGDRDLLPPVQRLVVWNQYNPKEEPSKYERTLTGWKLNSDISWTIHDFWTWQDLAKYRRREYVRVP